MEPILNLATIDQRNQIQQRSSLCNRMRFERKQVRQNRKQFEVSLHSEQRTLFYASAGFCWHHSVLGCLLSDPIGFLEDLEGRAATRRRTEKLQKRVREHWMRPLRGLHGEARVAGMYRNEWVHFGEFTRVPACLLKGALWLATPISPRVTIVLQYATFAPSRICDRKEGFEGCLWGMLRDILKWRIWRRIWRCISVFDIWELAGL